MSENMILEVEFCFNLGIGGVRVFCWVGKIFGVIFGVD